MEKLLLELNIKELKNAYTVEGDILKEWGVIKKPIMKKILYGTEIKKPTSYRVYETAYGSHRTWVFGELEINPDRYNLNEVKK